jgi:hypothetical protein
VPCTTKVLLAGMPEFLSDLLSVVIKGEWVEVVVEGEVHDPLQLLRAVHRLHAEFVILAQTDLAEAKKTCTNLLYRCPYLRVFVLPLAGGDVTDYRCKIDAVTIVEKPLDALLRAIREGKQD